MITLNDTPTTDKDVIWIIEIEDDSKTYYLSSQDITLSGQAYDGQTIKKDSIGDSTKDVNISEGGGIGSVGNFSFSIADKSANSDWNALFDDFYPNNSTYLTGRKVKFGLVWVGATTQAEITWLHLYEIEGIDWETALNIFCVEWAEAESKDLPPYEVQQSHDNGISYFPNALKESYGTPIPIVYGKFPLATVANIRQYDFSLAPTVPIDKLQLKFIVACHKCDSFGTGATYKYFPSVEGYFLLTGKKTDSGGGLTSVESSSNTNAGCHSILLNEGGIARGNGYVHPMTNRGDFRVGSTDYTPIEATKNVNDRDLDSYDTLTPGQEIHLGFDTDNIDPTLQNLTLMSGGSYLYVKAEGSGAGTTYDIRITSNAGLNEEDKEYGKMEWKRLRVSGGFGMTTWAEKRTFTVGTSATLDTTASLFFGTELSITDLMDFGIYLKNTHGSNSLKVYEVYWYFEGIKLQSVIRKRRGRQRVMVAPGYIMDAGDYLRGGSQI